MTRLDKFMVGVLVASALVLGGLITLAFIYPEMRVPLLFGAAGGAVVTLLGRRR